MITKRQAKQMRKILENHQDAYTDEETVSAPYILEQWRPGREYQKDKRLQYHGKAYRVVQTHNSYDGWLPPEVPGLYTEISLEEWPEWKQPTGAQDAYNKGDRVSFNGDHYISLIDGNTWSPADYPAGWEKQ